MADSEFMTGYSIGQNEGRGGGGLFGGGDGIWGFLVLALIFGWGGGGFGFGGGGNGAATRADINAGFQFQDLQNGIRGLTNGLCDSTFALNNAITGGFYGVDRGLCDIGHRIDNCCCENRAAIADLKYTMATESCATRNMMQNNTRDIIDSQNAGTRAILDFLTNDKIENLRAENQALKFRASQAEQNALFQANQEAQTAELIRRIAPSPVPSYQVPAPYPYCNNGGSNYGGCGCGI